MVQYSIGQTMSNLEITRVVYTRNHAAIWFSWHGIHGVNSWMIGYSGECVYLCPYMNWYSFYRGAEC